jgi:hypothetical protein
MPESAAENPMVADETPTRIEPPADTEPRPQELVDRLDKIEQQDEGTDERVEEPDWPTYGGPADDEGPLGEGGQLMGPDASSGTSS